VSSHASLVELRHDQPDWSSRLYYRRAEPFFGLKNQPAATTDLQTYGAEVRTKLSETLQLDSQLSSQTKISSDQTAQVAQSRIVFSDKTWQSTIGVRLGREKTALGASAEVNQLLASIGYTSPEQPWSLRVGAEVGNEKGRDQEIRLFPNRITMDADYRFTDRLSFTMSHHWLLAHQRSTEAQVGLRYASWQGAELQVGVSQRGWSDGQSTALRSSLVQTAKLNNLWTLNAQLTDSRLIDGTFSSQNFASSSGNTQLVTSPVTQPATQGDDFMSAGVTLSFNAKPWSGYFRAEKRWAEQSRLSLAGGISYHFNTDQHLISTLRVERSSEETSPSFQWTATHVLRPQFSPWSVLSRFEYIDNQHRASTSGSTQALSSGSNSNITGPITLTAGRRLLLSSHVNFLANNGLEWLNRLGYKRVLESYDQTNYGTSFVVLGTELRKPIGKTFDIGLHAVYARSLSNHVTNRGYGISVGARLLRNSVLTVGYNFKGIEDRDFYASNQRAAGVFVWLRILLDENLLGLSSATASALLESQ
jgi:hypothetical protein